MILLELEQIKQSSNTKSSRKKIHTSTKKRGHSTEAPNLTTDEGPQASCVFGFYIKITQPSSAACKKWKFPVLGTRRYLLANPELCKDPGATITQFGAWYIFSRQTVAPKPGFSLPRIVLEGRNNLSSGKEGSLLILPQKASPGPEFYLDEKCQPHSRVTLSTSLLFSGLMSVMSGLFGKEHQAMW